MLSSVWHAILSLSSYLHTQIHPYVFICTYTFTYVCIYLFIHRIDSNYLQVTFMLSSVWHAILWGNPYPGFIHLSMCIGLTRSICIYIYLYIYPQLFAGHFHALFCLARHPRQLPPNHHLAHTQRDSFIYIYIYISD